MTDSRTRGAVRAVATVSLAIAGVTCGRPDPGSGAAGATPAPPVTAHQGDPSTRLAARLEGMPAEPAARRNLFRFGTATVRSGSGERRGVAGELPEFPLPLPRPAIRVLGVATEGGEDGEPLRRTAILSVGGDLVLAPEGAVVAGRYRILSIGERDVQLVDQVDQHVERLALR